MRPATWLALLFAGAICSAAAHAQLRALPPVMGTLSDETGILSDADGRKLASELDGILEEDGIRVVLVIAETVRPETMDDYVQRLSRRWAIDRAIDPTRTIFIIVAIGDGELVVMPGRNLNLQSALAAPGITDGLTPLFREQRYYDALTMLAQRVHTVIHQHGVKQPAPRR